MLSNDLARATLEGMSNLKLADTLRVLAQEITRGNGTINEILMVAARRLEESSNG